MGPAATINKNGNGSDRRSSKYIVPRLAVSRFNGVGQGFHLAAELGQVSTRRDRGELRKPGPGRRNDVRLAECAA
jgi:hypothetical protein